jgi:hypothetical protein
VLPAAGVATRGAVALAAADPAAADSTTSVTAIADMA